MGPSSSGRTLLVAFSTGDFKGQSSWEGLVKVQTFSRCLIWPPTTTPGLKREGGKFYVYFKYCNLVVEGSYFIRMLTTVMEGWKKLDER